MLGNLLRAVRHSFLFWGGMSLLVLGAAGCVNQRPADVPGTAAFETGGRDRLVFVAPDSGTLYISDQDANALVYSGQVITGDRVVVEPDKHRVAINDQIVVSGWNVNRDEHRIYLLPDVGAPPVALSSYTVARQAGVPAAARIGAEGRDHLEYTGAQPGVAWVVDANTNTVLYRTRIGTGDRIVVDPAKNNLLVNGVRVFTGNLPPDDYRIFFAAGADAAVPVVPPGFVAVPAEAPAIVTTQLPAVPSAAVVLTDSSVLGTVTASQSGSVWVTDVATGRVIFSGFMRQGDTLIVNPGTGRITLNGEPVGAPGIVMGHYRVSFMSRK